MVLNIDGNLTQHIQNQDLIQQNQQLATLPYANKAQFNSFAQQHESQCVPDTRVALLDQLQEWSNNHKRCIFWLSGMAGTGKSTIARTIAHKFHEQKSLGASFFFSRGTGDLGHAVSFIGTLAHQLADTLPLFKRYICEALSAHHNIASQGLRNQWKELIVLPLSKLNNQRLSLNLVIDALDECENQEDIKVILQLFVETRNSAAVNFGVFVTSRPETPIQLGFRNIPDIMHQDLILQDIPRSIVEHDITVFLQHEFHQIGLERDLQDWPDERKIQLLVRASNCLFIYAATACRFIKDRKRLPEECLDLILQNDVRGNSPTARLDEIYTQILRCAITLDQDEKERAELSKWFKNIVGTIVLLFDVLSVSVLANLLLIPIRKVEVSLESLHSLLNIPRGSVSPIRLLHPSFREFLLDTTRCRDSHFWIDQRIVDKDVVTNCLHLMSNGLRKDICGLNMPGAPTSEIQDDINLRLSLHVQYACHYWVDHLERMDHNSRIEVGLCDNGQIHSFFKIHFLYWLEALSLMGKISQGIIIVTKLERMLQVRTISLRHKMIQNANEF